MGIRSAHSEEGFIVLEDFAVWLNRKRGRVGPLFQGRFKATIHDPEESGFKVQEYIHLNPVRVKRFGASRSPPAEQVEGMLREVEEYRWSSFRAYVGLTARPQWLHMDETLRKLFESLGRDPDGATQTLILRLRKQLGRLVIAA
jgi:hypothetical protein